MTARLFVSGRQFCLRAVFALMTLACLASALWQWPPGRVFLAASAAFVVLSSAHLIVMTAAFHVLETYLVPVFSGEPQHGRAERH